MDYLVNLLISISIPVVFFTAIIIVVLKTGFMYYKEQKITKLGVFIDFLKYLFIVFTILVVFASINTTNTYKNNDYNVSKEINVIESKQNVEGSKGKVEDKTKPIVPNKREENQFNYK